MTTMRGKSMTTPRGMEMAELPLRRRGLRKKARRDHNLPGCVFDLWSFSSAVGSGGGPERALPARRIRSMAGDVRDCGCCDGIRWYSMRCVVMRCDDARPGKCALRVDGRKRPINPGRNWKGIETLLWVSGTGQADVPGRDAVLPPHSSELVCWSGRVKTPTSQSRRIQALDDGETGGGGCGNERQGKKRSLSDCDVAAGRRGGKKRGSVEASSLDGHAPHCTALHVFLVCFGWQGVRIGRPMQSPWTGASRRAVGGWSWIRSESIKKGSSGCWCLLLLVELSLDKLDLGQR